ncbi:acyl-CoA thioesterase [Natronogracilivirga saccharolytica]|nr:thioesterase family protein [Natronogracilivirga saccharolytica]
MLPDKDPLVTYEMQLRSRYSETDKMGVVYHSRYLEYFEVIRTEFIREAGLSYAEMEERGVMLPVANVEIRFRRPILYDELMNGRLMVFDEPAVRLVTYYDIRPAGSHQSSVTGKVELVFVDAATRRPVRAPEFFKKKMQSYAGMA